MAVKNAILQKHFEKCGFDDDFFNDYESVTNDTMQNVDEMCSRLYDIREKNQKIVIYTDYDVDGIMSSVIACAGLSQLGFDVELFKPTPSDGYGIRTSDIDDVRNSFPTASVILTGDVGVSCNDAIKYAQAAGFTVLVTDHHTGLEPCLADVTVNPNQFGETYSDGYICGSYVLYKVIERFANLYCSRTQQADIYRLQLFAGIATISDVMPLLHENRQLVRNSISLMRYFYAYELSEDNTIAPPVYSDNYSRAFVGVKKLLEYFRSLKKIRTAEDIDEQFYAFYLVPFLNSTKRMDGDMRGVYDIFFSKYIHPFPDFENMSCVDNGIKYVEILNFRRKELTSFYTNQLIEEKTAHITENSKYMQCEVYITTASAGLLGLLASSFIGVTGVPTLVLNENPDGSYSGSGRNPSFFDFANTLLEHGINISCPGHREAFGVFIPDKSVLLDYVRFFRDFIIPEFIRLSLDKTAVSDTRISIAHQGCTPCDFVSDSVLIKDFMSEVQRYHPFGRAFPKPGFIYYVRPDAVSEKMFGSENQHAKLITNDGIEILLFNQALDLEKIKYDNKDDDYLFACSGSFKYDDFDNAEYDTLNFLADSIEAVKV